MDSSTLIVFGAIIVVAMIIFVSIKAAKAYAERERQRLAGLVEWGRLNGFNFTKGDPFDLDLRYRNLAQIGHGHDRYAFEVLHRAEPVTTLFFQYHFKTWETRTVRRGNRTYTERYEVDHWQRYFLAELGTRTFPGLAIRGENWFDKFAGFVGFDDIDFESEEFSSKYHVKSSDKQFAYAMIHPQMMEWLMKQQFYIELKDGLAFMDLSSRPHTAQDCQDALADLSGFIKRIPPFVWEDYGKRQPIKLPEAVPYAPPAVSPNGIPGKAL